MADRFPMPGLRRGALLAVFLAWVFGALPFLSAAHSHEQESGHDTCQLCLASAPAHSAPVPAVAAAPAPLLLFILPDPDPAPRRAFPAAYASRGPPSA